MPKLTFQPMQPEPHVRAPYHAPFIAAFVVPVDEKGWLVARKEWKGEYISAMVFQVALLDGEVGCLLY